MKIRIDQLAAVVGGGARPQQLPQQFQPQFQMPSEYGPRVGHSTWQPPGAGYHINYGPWQNGSASSWSTVDNKSGQVIESGQNPPQ